MDRDRDRDPDRDQRPGRAEPDADQPGLPPLPVMPGFREMARRLLADEHAARMADDRVKLVRELAERRLAAGLSQTEIAARMGTSQSAVARLESSDLSTRPGWRTTASSSSVNWPNGVWPPACPRPRSRRGWGPPSPQSPGWSRPI